MVGTSGKSHGITTKQKKIRAKQLEQLQYKLKLCVKVETDEQTAVATLAEARESEKSQ